MRCRLSAPRCLSLTADVGATMNNRTNKSDDPVVGDTATSRPASSLLENRWNSQKTEMNSPNKALHHYGAQSAPRVNADVGPKTIK